MPGNLDGLVDWLEREATQRIQNAKSRREYSSAVRNATTAELRYAKDLAEKMAGHRLEVSASKKAAAESADIDDRIASKLEAEARQLKQWAEAMKGEGHE
jgi:hypothetical protein